MIHDCAMVVVDSRGIGRSPGKIDSFFAREGDDYASYQGFSKGITVLTEPLAAETEITGPLVAKLWVSASTPDADIFLAVRVYDERGNEKLFEHDEEPTEWAKTGLMMRGSSNELHDDPLYRPADIYDNDVTIHSGPGRESYLLLPVIPAS